MDSYKITIDPEYASDEQELGIDQIAFTSNPAIKVKGLAFNSQTKPLSFSDKVKMRIAAPALIPMDIYRYDEQGEYYVTFTQDEIEKIHVKFMGSLNNKDKFNLEHTETDIAPAFLLECWLVGKKNLEDRSYSEFGIEVPEGTMFIVAQVTNKEYFNSLVGKGQVGFSIEGFLGLKLSEIDNINKQKKETNMQELFLPDGEYVVDGKTYIVKDGKVTEIVDIVKDEVPETELQDAVPETELQDEVIVTVDETKILEIVEPKLDEIYQIIADLKAVLDNKVDIKEEKVIEEVVMNIHSKFKSVTEFLSK